MRSPLFSQIWLLRSRSLDRAGRQELLAAGIDRQQRQLALAVAAMRQGAGMVALVLTAEEQRRHGDRAGAALAASIGKVGSRALPTSMGGGALCCHTGPGGYRR